MVRDPVVGTLVGISVARVGSERTSEIEFLVGDLFDLFTHKVVTRLTHTTVSVPVVERVPGTSHTDSSDPDVVPLAETTVLVEVLVKSTLRSHKQDAGKSSHVVDLSHGALTAVGGIVSGVPEGEVSLGAHASLSVD